MLLTLNKNEKLLVQETNTQYHNIDITFLLETSAGVLLRLALKSEK